MSLPPGHDVRPLKDNRGSTIEWRELRSHVDHLGQQHRVIAQFLLTPWGDVRLDGSEVGLHYRDDGALRFADGDQFTAVNIEVTPSFSLPDLPARAIQALRRSTPAPLNRSALRLVSDAKLVVYRAGSISRVGYEVGVIDGAELPYTVRLDAVTDSFVRAIPLFAGSNCTPDSTTPVTASGTAVRSDVGTRTLTATSTSRGAFTYEGHKPATGTTPQTQIYQSVPWFDTFSCGQLDYTLFPVRTENNSPSYSDGSDQFLGRRAGDGLHQTTQTMEAFRQIDPLGRIGWDRNGSTARVLVSTDTSSVGGALFQQTATAKAPANTVIIHPKSSTQQYALEAALDVVAHEYGHGMLFSWPTQLTMTYDYSVSPALQGAELHEGFSDAIGHMVERLRQQADWYGTEAPETHGDWKIGEDAIGSGGSFRRADVDDTTVKSHRFDTGFVESYHNRGNQMHVMFRLLVQGGKNPFCVANPTEYGCSYTSNGLGLDKAAKIMRHAIENYVRSGSRWTHLANYFRQSAYDLYRNCGGTNPNADYEQGEVQNAFWQIGYPADTFYSCP